MGGCVSRPNGCVGGRLIGGTKKKCRKKTKSVKKRVSSHVSDRSADKVDKSSFPLDRSFNNPTFNGNFYLIDSVCTLICICWAFVGFHVHFDYDY